MRGGETSVQATEESSNQALREDVVQDGGTQTAFPEDLNQCHALIASLRELLSQRDADLEKLKHHIHDLLRSKYGRMTEKINPDQLLIFAQQLLEQPPEDADQDDPEPAQLLPPNKKGKHGGGGRNPLPESAPPVEKDYYPDVLTCACCGEALEEIGVEVTEQLDYVPANFRRILHRVHKLSCQKCHKGVFEGKKPEQIHSGGEPTEGMLSQLITSKHVDHSPLERQSKTYARQGVILSVSTMGRWMRMSAKALRPIVERMHQLVLKCRLLEADESPFDFLDKKRVLKKIKQGYFWAYYGDDDYPYVVFDFQVDRCKERPMKFLTGYDGYLLTDGYGGYVWYDQEKSLNCNVHCRRYFEKAKKANKKEAGFALAVYQKLYEIEARIRDLSEDQRLKIRQEEAVPLLEKFHKWLLEKKQTEQPKSLLGVAVNYALERWEKLTRYTTSGFLKMDTNLVENSIRPHAITRKNCMFAGSEDGGETAAIHASIVNTCKRLGINPFNYLRDVLTRLGANPSCDIDELLPDRWKPAQPP
jgi:transposase